MSDNLTPEDRALCGALDGYGIEEETLDRAKQRIRDLSRQLAAAEADAARLAEAVTVHAQRECLGCQNALAAHAARLIDG